MKPNPKDFPTIPPIELEMYQGLIDEIKALKKEKDAIVLGHNYMHPLVYWIADFKGDSLNLSRKAATTDRQTVVFCGVPFMAETAAILSPTKNVLIPSLKGGCSLADSITPQDIIKLRLQYPGIPVIAYVNTTAATKAEVDVCCTSGNAKNVVRWALQQFKTNKLIFLPDRYLATNIARDLDADIFFPTKENQEIPPTDKAIQIIGWDGSCEVHKQFTVKDIESIRTEYPTVKILAHPECSEDVVAASDFSGSTNAMIAEAKKTLDRPVYLATECSMADNILTNAPGCKLIRMCSYRCPHMAMITLENLRDSLKFNQYQVKLDPEISSRARLSLERMISI